MSVAAASSPVDGVKTPYGTIRQRAVGPNVKPLTVLALPKSRFCESDELIRSTGPSVNNTFDVLRNVATAHANKHCFGWRDYTDVKAEEKTIMKMVNGVETTETKTFFKYGLSPYKWMTYQDMFSIVQNVGDHLVGKLGAVPNETKVLIYCETR